MANKKRRRRPQAPRPGGGAARSGGGAPRSGGARQDEADEQTRAPRRPSGPSQPQNRPRADRQARKQQARQAREAARRAQRRRAAVRRFVISLVVAGVAVGVILLLTRVDAPKNLPQAAVDAASAAGCSSLQTPSATATGGQHLASGETFAYDQHPATSGPHDPSALSGENPVFTEMPSETQLVHNLEHAFVNIYYRADGETALPQPVIDGLTTLVQGDERTHSILTPHTSLPDGVDLAVTAWNKLITCPSGVSPGQATAIAQGFMDAYVCTSNAPEPKASAGC